MKSRAQAKTLTGKEGRGDHIELAQETTILDIRPK